MSNNTGDFAWHTAIPVETNKRYATVRRAFNRWLLDVDNPLIDSGEEVLHVKIRKGRASRTVHMSIEHDKDGTATISLREGTSVVRLPIDMRDELRPPEEHDIYGTKVLNHSFQEIWNSCEHISEVVERLGIDAPDDIKTPVTKRVAYLAYKLRNSGMDIKKFKRGRKVHQKDKFKRKRKGSAVS